MPPKVLTLDLPDEAATLHCAAQVFGRIPLGSLLFLRGQLGAGKTTFVRGYLRAAGFAGPVKSPTFTLVEEYVLPSLTLFHFDLYRLNAPEELEWLGFRDYLRPDAVSLIEWPERGAGVLPEPDLDIGLEYHPPGRVARLQAGTEPGQRLVDWLSVLRS